MTAENEFSIATLPSLVGKELGVSPWMVVDQQRINEFAHCTGDDQWIHVDVARANKESPFGAPVAHGFLTLSLLAKMGMEIGLVPKDALASFNYGLNKVRFITPVKVGARLRARVTVGAVVDQGKGRHLVTMINTMEIEGEVKPALIAEILVVLAGAA
jgi:acyl dehydratase